MAKTLGHQTRKNYILSTQMRTLTYALPNECLHYS